jgi:hypothetical protein
LTNAADDEFYLQEDNPIQIVCKNEERPGGFCKANGEVENLINAGGLLTISKGNGVCQTCPTNQPADIMACDAAAECTCSKCNSTDYECREIIGECDMPSDATSKSTSMTFAAGMVLTLASSVLML